MSTENGKKLPRRFEVQKGKHQRSGAGDILTLEDEVFPSGPGNFLAVRKMFALPPVDKLKEKKS